MDLLGHLVGVGRLDHRRSWRRAPRPRGVGVEGDFAQQELDGPPAHGGGLLLDALFELVDVGRVGDVANLAQADGLAADLA